MKYERLTVKRNGKNYIKTPLDGTHDCPFISHRVGKYEYTTGEAIDRLAELEDMIVNNVLIPIPLPLNSKAFIIMGNKSIKEVVIIKYEFELSGKYAEVMWYEGDRKMIMYVRIDELNKTKEAAEAKLEELKNK